MVTIRLDPALEEAISETAKKLGLTKSELIRQSIIEYLDRLKKPTAGSVGLAVPAGHKVLVKAVVSPVFFHLPEALVENRHQFGPPFMLF